MSDGNRILPFHSYAIRAQAAAAGVDPDVFGANVLAGREERIASLKGGNAAVHSMGALAGVSDQSERVVAPKIRTVYRWNAALGCVVADGVPDSTGTP